MPYATPTDMEVRFGATELVRLSAPDGALDGVADLGKVELAITDATALIDSHIRRRFQTPLSPVPPEILAACCDIARYRLAHGEGRTPTEQMRDAYRDTLRFLERLADGKASLPDAAPVVAASSFARTSDRPALFQPPGSGGLY
jgi:phage gp36-like protein